MNRIRSQKIDSVQGWLSPVSDGYGKPGLGIGTIYRLIIVGRPYKFA